MKKITLVDRLHYAFDNTMSRGLTGLVVWLAALTAALVLGVSLAVRLLGAEPSMAFPQVLWTFFFQAVTPGAIDAAAGSRLYLGAMLLLTLASLFIVSIFIGILTNIIDQRIQALRKGRSRVLEAGHTLILGWSPQVFTIVRELAIANENRPRGCVVILADMDKVEMEDEIRTRTGGTRNTRVVCRTGSPHQMVDIDMVNPQHARSIIIPSPDGDDPDMQVVKTMLAVTKSPNRRAAPYNIVAEIRQPSNFDVAKMVGGDEAELVVVGDLISHITAQTCRQPGLSTVYVELLNFEGDEMYMKTEPALVGKTYGEALLAYEDSAVIGLQFENGMTQLNPPMETRIGAADRIIAITEDDDTIVLSGRSVWDIDADAILDLVAADLVPERTLILGWNERARGILDELEKYVAPGSKTVVVPGACLPGEEPTPTWQNQAVRFEEGDPAVRQTLNRLAIPGYQHVIVLGCVGSQDVQEADTRTLLTLLHLRDIREKHDGQFAIVSEMLDVRNREVAEAAEADDFVVSDELTSLLLAQLSENRSLNAVFGDLFDAEGSEVYLRCARDYVRLDRQLTFYTVVEACRRRNETVIGYRLQGAARSSSSAHGVVLNPDKSARVCFTEGDKIIVLAQG